METAKEKYAKNVSGAVMGRNAIDGASFPEELSPHGRRSVLDAAETAWREGRYEDVLPTLAKPTDVLVDIQKADLSGLSDGQRQALDDAYADARFNKVAELLRGAAAHTQKGAQGAAPESAEVKELPKASAKKTKGAKR